MNNGGNKATKTNYNWQDLNLRLKKTKSNPSIKPNRMTKLKIIKIKQKKWLKNNLKKSNKKVYSKTNKSKQDKNK